MKKLFISLMCFCLFSYKSNGERKIFTDEEVQALLKMHKFSWRKVIVPDHLLEKGIIFRRLDGYIGDELVCSAEDADRSGFYSTQNVFLNGQTLASVLYYKNNEDSFKRQVIIYNKNYTISVLSGDKINGVLYRLSDDSGNFIRQFIVPNNFVPTNINGLIRVWPNRRHLPEDEDMAK
jgi:hypothetical protein